MRITILGVSTALFGLVYSQAATLPACAQGCVTSFTTGGAIGGCPSLDIKCICSSQSFLSSIACCLATSCNPTDQAAAVTYAKQICTTAGVTVPDQVVCNSASSSVAVSTTPMPASSASSAVSATSAGSAVVSASSAITSAASSVTSASASASSSVSKAGGFQNAPGAGISFAGGLFAALVLL